MCLFFLVFFLLFFYPPQILAPLFTFILRKLCILGKQVVVEVELSPLSIILRRVELWQFLIDSANNRFFFGPMCMPVDSVTCDEIRFDLGFNDLYSWFKLQTIPFKVKSFKVFFHRAYENEWNENSRQFAYTRWRRGTANWVCSLIEPLNEEWEPQKWQFLMDLILAHLDIQVDKLHLRIEDKVNDVAFGIAIERWHLSSEWPGQDSLFAPRRTFDMENIQFYFDKTCRLNKYILIYSYVYKFIYIIMYSCMCFIYIVYV